MRLAKTCTKLGIAAEAELGVAVHPKKLQR
jgi:hypothetical protein